MNSVPALQETDVRIASGRSHAEEPNDSKATFQDAVDARREERARSASKRNDAGTEDVGEAREDVREPRSEDSGDRSSESAEEAPDDATEQPQPQRRERHSDAREARDGSAPVEGGSIQRGIPRGAKRASATSGDAVQGALELAGFSIALPEAPSPISTAAASPPAQGQSPSGSVVGGAAAPAPASEPLVAPQGSVSPSGTPVPGFDAAPSGATSPAVEALATLHAARAASSAAHHVDPRVATGASGAAPAGESAAAREPFTPRVSTADLPGFLQGLAVHIDSPQRSAVVDLDPAELGRVSISLSLERDGHVRADVRAQRPEGYAALEARLPELRASLIERGFSSASVNLSLGLPDSRSQRSGAEDGRGNSSQNRGRTLAASEIQALLPSTPTRPGAVDLWA